MLKGIWARFRGAAATEQTPPPAPVTRCYANVVQSAVEKLLEDERARASLVDDEANLLVNWAVGWLEERVANAPDEQAARQIAQAEMARLRPSLYKINDLLAKDKTPPLSSAAVALGLPATGAVAGGALDRKALIQTLTSNLAHEWSK